MHRPKKLYCNFAGGWGSALYFGPASHVTESNSYPVPSRSVLVLAVSDRVRVQVTVVPCGAWHRLQLAERPSAAPRPPAASSQAAARGPPATHRAWQRRRRARSTYLGNLSFSFRRLCRVGCTWPRHWAISSYWALVSFMPRTAPRRWACAAREGRGSVGCASAAQRPRQQAEEQRQGGPQARDAPHSKPGAEAVRRRRRGRFAQLRPAARPGVHAGEGGERAGEPPCRAAPLASAQVASAQPRKRRDCEGLAADPCAEMGDGGVRQTMLSAVRIGPANERQRQLVHTSLLRVNCFATSQHAKLPQVGFYSFPPQCRWVYFIIPSVENMTAIK